MNVADQDSIAEFKWRRAELTERSAAQQHFLDLCELLDHPKPAEVDPRASSSPSRRAPPSAAARDGWADVWKRGYFAWEYKGRHKDLDAAYRQLDEYRAALENPPLLVTCDMDRIVVHTNFTATRQEVHEIPLDASASRATWRSSAPSSTPRRSSSPAPPARRSPPRPPAGPRRSPSPCAERGLDPLAVARFLDRVVFCSSPRTSACCRGPLHPPAREEPPPTRSSSPVRRQLFAAMAEGGFFGLDEIRHFNGNLFETRPVLELTAEEIEASTRPPASTGAPSTRRSSAPSSSAASDPASAPSSAPTTPAARTSRPWSSRWS
jgi:hypothetical protein